MVKISPQNHNCGVDLQGGPSLPYLQQPSHRASTSDSPVFAAGQVGGVSRGARATQAGGVGAPCLCCLKATRLGASKTRAREARVASGADKSFWGVWGGRGGADGRLSARCDEGRWRRRSVWGATPCIGEAGGIQAPGAAAAEGTNTWSPNGPGASAELRLEGFLRAREPGGVLVRLQTPA